MKLEIGKTRSIGELIVAYLRNSGRSINHNNLRIFYAWDAISGAAPYTQKKYFREGKLYITLSSSVVRNALFLRKQELIDKINIALDADPLFLKDAPGVVKVTDLILK